MNPGENVSMQSMFVESWQEYLNSDDKHDIETMTSEFVKIMEATPNSPIAMMFTAFCIGYNKGMSNTLQLISEDVAQ